MPGHLHISPNSYFLGFEWNILNYDPSNHDGDDGNHERCAYVKVWKKVLPSQEGDGKPEGTPHLVHFISWSRDDDEADYDGGDNDCIADIIRNCTESDIAALLSSP